jgi:hypothetical protein
LEPGIAQRHVGLVAQGSVRGVFGLESTDLIEHFGACLDLPKTHERDANVVFREADPGVARPLPGLEHCERFGEAPLLHEHLCVEHLPPRLELLGELCADARQCRLGLGEVAALVPNGGQEEPRSILHLRLHRLLQDTLKDLAGQAVLTVGQIQAAEHELGFGTVVRELATLLRGQQTSQRGEIVVLKVFEQNLAIGEILHHGTRVTIARAGHAAGEHGQCGRRQCR